MVTIHFSVQFFVVVVFASFRILCTMLSQKLVTSKSGAAAGCYGCGCTTSGFNRISWIEVKVIIDSWFIYILEAAMCDENAEITWTWTSSASCARDLLNNMNKCMKQIEWAKEKKKKEWNGNKMIYELCHKSRSDTNVNINNNNVPSKKGNVNKNTHYKKWYLVGRSLAHLCAFAENSSQGNV